jgi:reactive intermediate/imine deaminase
MKEEIKVKGFAPPISHYTQAVRFGNLLFISGIGPTDEDYNIVGGGDVAAQTRQVFEKMKKVLDEVGLGFGDILKVTVYLTDIDDRTLINPVRQEYFGESLPASTLVGVKELIFPEMKIEVEAIAGFPN